MNWEALQAIAVAFAALPIAIAGWHKAWDYVWWASRQVSKDDRRHRTKWFKPVAAMWRVVARVFPSRYIGHCCVCNLNSTVTNLPAELVAKRLIQQDMDEAHQMLQAQYTQYGSGKQYVETPDWWIRRMP